MTRLKIDSVDFGVRKFIIEYKERHYDEDGTHYFGTVNYVHGVITLEEDHIYDDMVLTLMHEINHIIETIFGVSEKSTQEERVEAYAYGFVTVMKLNPDLAKLLQAPEGK